jgi:ABC-type multidrug transport system fused ATPase/permease subunit
VLALTPSLPASLRLSKVAVSKASDEFPAWAFLIAPIAFYRAIHLFALRTYNISMLDAEMSNIILFLLLDAVLYFIGAQVDPRTSRDRASHASAVAHASPAPHASTAPLAPLISAASRADAVPAALSGAQYLDAVLPRQFGVVRHPLFCLNWCGSKKVSASANRHDVATNEDSDVRAAREAVEARYKLAADGGATSSTTDEPKPTIESISLRKVYRGGKVACRNLSFAINQDECFGLLGPNGAGKTTAISMWTGLFPPSSGTAKICGFDLRTQMAKISQVMGVCPQVPPPKSPLEWPTVAVARTALSWAYRRRAADGVVRRACSPVRSSTSCGRFSRCTRRCASTAKSRACPQASGRTRRSPLRRRSTSRTRPTSTCAT